MRQYLSSQAVGAGLVLLALSGCQYIPGSARYAEEEAKRRVGEVLIDPASAQFRNVKSLGPNKYYSETWNICGEVNGKNRMGAYAGFTRFIVRTGNNPVLDPQISVTPEEVQLAEQECEEDNSSEYGRISAKYSCRRAGEKTQELRTQGMFEDLWRRQCDH